MTSRKTRQLFDHSVNQTINQNNSQHERISNISHLKSIHSNSNSGDILNHLNIVQNSNKNGKNDGVHMGTSTISNNINSRRNEFSYSHYTHNHKNIKESLNHKSSINNSNINNIDLQNLFSPGQTHRTSTNINNCINNENASFRTPIPKNPKWKTSISNFINSSTNNSNSNANTAESKAISKVQGLSNSKRAQLLAKFKKQVFFFVSKTSDPNIARLHKKVVSLGATVETFFSSKVTHKIVEDSRELTQRLINEEKREYLYPKPKENVNELKKSKNIVNCKEWTISYLIRRISQIITDPGSTQQRLSLTQRLQQEKVIGTGLNTSREIHLLRQYYLVVEDALSLHRPIAVREYPIPKPEEKNLPSLWPQLYLIENPNGRSPFNPPQPRDFIRHQQKANKNESNNSSKKANNHNINNIDSNNNKISKTNNINNTNNKNNDNEDNIENNNNNNSNSNNKNSNYNQNNVQDIRQQASTLIDKQQESHSHIRHVHVGNSIASGIVSFSIISKKDAGEIVVPISQYAKEKDWKRKEISISDKREKVENKKSKSFQQKSVSKSGDKSAIRPPAFMNKPGYCENCSMKFMNFGEHIKSMVHRSFARNKNNFVSLDKLIDEIKKCQKEDEEAAFNSDSSSDSSSDDDYIPSSEEKSQDGEITTTTDLEESALNTYEEEDDDEDDEDDEYEDEEIKIGTGLETESQSESESDTESEQNVETEELNLNTGNDGLKEESDTELSYTVEEEDDDDEDDEGDDEKTIGNANNNEEEEINKIINDSDKTLKNDTSIRNLNLNNNENSIDDGINEQEKTVIMKEINKNNFSDNDNNKVKNKSKTIEGNVFNVGQSSPSKCLTDRATLNLIKEILMENEQNKDSNINNLLLSNKSENLINNDNKENLKKNKKEIENNIVNTKSEINEVSKNIDHENDNKQNDVNGKNDILQLQKFSESNNNDNINNDNINNDNINNDNDNNINNRDNSNNNVNNEQVSTLDTQNKNKDETKILKSKEDQIITNQQKLKEMEEALKKQYGLNLDSSKNLNFGSYYSETFDTTELSELNQKSIIDMSTTAMTEEISSEDVNINLSIANKKSFKEKITGISSDVNIDMEDPKKELLLEKYKIEILNETIKRLNELKEIDENKNESKVKEGGKETVIEENKENKKINERKNNENEKQNNNQEGEENEEINISKNKNNDNLEQTEKHDDKPLEKNLNKDENEQIIDNGPKINDGNNQNDELPSTPKLENLNKMEQDKIENESFPLSEENLSNTKKRKSHKKIHITVEENIMKSNEVTPKIQRIRTVEIENKHDIGKKTDLIFDEIDKNDKNNDSNSNTIKSNSEINSNVNDTKIDEVKHNTKRGRPRKNHTEVKEKSSKKKMEKSNKKNDNDQAHQLENEKEVIQEGSNKRKRIHNNEIKAISVKKPRKSSKTLKRKEDEINNKNNENVNIELNNSSTKNHENNEILNKDNGNDNTIKAQSSTTKRKKRSPRSKDINLNQEAVVETPQSSTKPRKSRKRKIETPEKPIEIKSEVNPNSTPVVKEEIIISSTLYDKPPSSSLMIESININQEKETNNQKLTLSLNRNKRRKDNNNNNNINNKIAINNNNNNIDNKIEINNNNNNIDNKIQINNNNNIKNKIEINNNNNGNHNNNKIEINNNNNGNHNNNKIENKIKDNNDKRNENEINNNENDNNKNENKDNNNNNHDDNKNGNIINNNINISINNVKSIQNNNNDNKKLKNDRIYNTPTKLNNGLSIADMYKKFEDNIPSNDDVDKKLNFLLSTLENSEFSSFTSDIAPPPPHQLLDSEKKRKPTKSQLNIISSSVANSSEGDIVIPSKTFNQHNFNIESPLKSKSNSILYTYKNYKNQSSNNNSFHSNFTNTNINSNIKYNIPLHPINSTNSSTTTTTTNTTTNNNNNSNSNNINNIKEKESNPKSNHNNIFSDLKTIENEKKLDSILSLIENDDLFSNVIKKANDTPKKTSKGIFRKVKIEDEESKPNRIFKNEETDMKEKVTSLVDNPKPIYFSYLTQNNQNSSDKES